MEQLSLFNLQRQCLKHPCGQLHLHHVMFTEDSGGQREEALLISLIVAVESLERNKQLEYRADSSFWLLSAYFLLLIHSVIILFTSLLNYLE